MRKLLLVIAMAMALYGGLGPTNLLQTFIGVPTALWQAVPAGRSDELQTAFSEQKSGIQVAGEGVVTKLLADDNEGSRHQRFILRLSSRQTLLVAHNIDLAPRIDALKTGDTVVFHGVYEWNAKGGVIHWTHRDPYGRHQAGWLKHGGILYQ